MHNRFREAFRRAREAAPTFFTQVPGQSDWFVTRKLGSDADWQKAETPVDGIIPEVRIYEESKIDRTKLLKIGTPMAERFFFLFADGAAGPQPGTVLRELVKINKAIGHDVCRNLTGLLAQDQEFVARCIEKIETFTGTVRGREQAFIFIFDDMDAEPLVAKLDPRERLKVVNAVSAYFTRLYDVAQSGEKLDDAEMETLAAGISGILNERQLGAFLDECCALSKPSEPMNELFSLRTRSTCLPDGTALIAHYWPQVKEARKDAEGIAYGDNVLMPRSWAQRNAPLIINTTAQAGRGPVALLTEGQKLLPG